MSSMSELQDDLTLERSTMFDYQKILKETDSRLEETVIELEALKKHTEEIESKLLKANQELEAYLTRLEESQLENLPQFRYIELARAGRSNNINVAGINQDYPFLWESCFLVSIYYIVATSLVYYYHEGFKGMTDKQKLWDAFYFVAVLSSAIGYGDIYPESDTAVTLTLLLFLASGLNSIFTRIIFSHIWTAIRRALLSATVGVERKFCIAGLALLAILVSFSVGTIGAEVDLKKNENIPDNRIGRDAISLSIVTLTTVGFGNVSFLTTGGRVFASIWILTCVPPFTWASSYLMELAFCGLRDLWQDWLKPFLWDTAFPFLGGLVFPAALAYV